MIKKNDREINNGKGLYKFIYQWWRKTKKTRQERFNQIGKIKMSKDIYFSQHYLTVCLKHLTYFCLITKGIY